MKKIMIIRSKNNNMIDRLVANTGSFRDPANKVYELNLESRSGEYRILRGLSEGALSIYKRLSCEDFFCKLLEKKLIIRSKLLSNFDKNAKNVISDGWTGVLEHQTVPFVSYPYEWTFTMLKDAALLQLYLVEKSLEEGWILKDATPYNIQWIGSSPIFIDIPSFEPWVEGEPWVGYRQFCTMFLTPLMLKAHLGIDHLPLLRSYVDGIPPTEAVKFFTGIKKLKKGILSHIVFPAIVENSISKRERDAAPIQQRTPHKHTKSMVIGLVQSLSRLVKKLSNKIEHTDWSLYDKTHSYQDSDLNAKKAFVLKHASEKKRDQIWDIGCNTGTFSKVCSKICNQVISIDGDQNAVELLYLNEKVRKGSNILSLVLNVSNLSPGQGWAGVERQAFDRRKKPDLVLCLALIHHVRMSANIPNSMFLKWLHSLEADVVLEFINRKDEMTIKLLTNKKEQYEDYNFEQFITEVGQFFKIEDRMLLKNGKREIFYLTPINSG